MNMLSVMLCYSNGGSKYYVGSTEIFRIKHVIYTVSIFPSLNFC